MPDPELTFYISSMCTIKGDAEGMDSLILRTRGWTYSLQFVSHLATRIAAWLESDLNYLPVFPALVIGLTVEKIITIEIQ